MNGKRPKKARVGDWERKERFTGDTATEPPPMQPRSPPDNGRRCTFLSYFFRPQRIKTFKQSSRPIDRNEAAALLPECRRRPRSRTVAAASRPACRNAARRCGCGRPT